VAAAEHGGHERNPRPVRQMDMARSVKQDRVGAGAGREMTDVLAAER
jgi:hypothetical protein